MSGQNIWEILTAVGTLGAVVVALFLPMWQARRRLSVEVAPPSTYSDMKTIPLVVTNSGGKVITIVRVLTRGQDGKTTDRLVAQQSPTLPCTLRPSDLLSLSIPYISENLREIKEILVENC